MVIKIKNKYKYQEHWNVLSFYIHKYKTTKITILNLGVNTEGVNEDVGTTS